VGGFILKKMGRLVLSSENFTYLCEPFVRMRTAGMNFLLTFNERLYRKNIFPLWSRTKL
jgi:hypothetical protein